MHDSNISRLYSLALPDPEDSNLVFATREVRKTPRVIEGGSLAAVSEVIDPRPPDLLALRRAREDEAQRELVVAGWAPDSLQTIATVGHLCLAGSLVPSRGDVNVGILQEPLSWVF